jgi:SNF2 family DNA or RNA helicase
MGLGKTLQTLALIAANPPTGIKYPRKSRSIGSVKAPVCTLIVSPLTVISNWELQIHQYLNERVENKNLSAMKYHGSKREDILMKVKQGQVDVLMTSYHTLASDYKTWLADTQSEDGGLRKKKKQRKAPFIFELDFHRIILDEGTSFYK